MKQYRWCIIMGLMMATILIGCTTTNNRQKSMPEPTVTASNESTFRGVVRVINTETQMMTLCNISTDTEVGFSYSGATQFLSKNGSQLSASQLQAGEIVDIYSENQNIFKIQIAADTILNENVSNVLVNRSDGYVQYKDVKYKYSGGLVVASKGRLVDVSDIVAMDRVTLRGVQGHVYSIVIEEGHGYIKPGNYGDFVGGTLIVDGEFVLPVTAKMLVPIREGTYRVIMKNGDYTGETTVTVERDKEFKLDMSRFRNQPSHTGQVEFDINPQGAELYVNGAQVRYSKPVSLKYGKHSIVVKLEGYTDYSGTLDVQSANPTVRIDLAKESANVETNDESTVATNNDKQTSSVTTDATHQITVSEPEGASVYVGGIYKGIVPCSFAKQIGTVTISLSKSGYTTKSYTVEISNDGKDITWKFPELEKK